MDISPFLEKNFINVKLKERNLCTSSKIDFGTSV